MKLTHNTTIFSTSNATPITHAIRGLTRDVAGIFGQEPAQASAPAPDQVRITIQPSERVEAFRIRVDDGERCVLIEGSDDLGAVFGVYHFCEHMLGVDPYQFWTEFPYQQPDAIDLPAQEFVSPEPKVRFRGWFVNDEDCLMGWHDDMTVSLATWGRLFETLLRAGYNMVIPGTGSQPDDPQLQLAADMGIWLAQHHAEPLGAHLFNNVYPGIAPRIPEELERFTALYREAIHAQQGRKVVWSLGFRGQGDCPFFLNDPRYDTLEKRGKVISDMIRLQKQLVIEEAEGPHHFVHNVYSESAELYRAGYLELDDDVIRVWADNGFGAMRARREWRTDPNVSSLPLPGDRDRLSGVYYHLSFHDLQLASKVTPIVAPDLIHDQFRQLYEAGNIQYLTLNVSNVRPHVFNIDLIGKLTRFSPAVSVEQHYADWTGKYFPGHERAVADLIARYHRLPFRYGPHEDDLAGEQVCHHGLRNAISAVAAGENVMDWRHSFHYIADPVTGNADCFQWLLDRAEPTLPGWIALQADADAISNELTGYQARFFADVVRMPVDYMACSYRGLVAGLQGLLAYMDGDDEEAFCLMSQSKWFMDDALQALLVTEHGKWRNFFRGEWLTGTRETIRRLETMRGLCRIRGDVVYAGPLPAWIPKAVGFEGGAGIHTIIQAIPDYDALAMALLRHKEGAKNTPSDLLR